ncbi:MAG: benzoate-CoA ligase family protein [Sneathiellaceae bacterium]
MSDAATLKATAHVDSFARDHLPPTEQWPEIDLTGVPELGRYPEWLNCATELLDRQVAAHGDRPAFRTETMVWTYRELQEKANRIAHVLVDELGVQPGNRVLLRAPNNPMYVACWFAVMKVGAIAVATMPLLRWRELTYMAEKARIRVALCDSRLAEEMEKTLERSDDLQQALYFNSDSPAGLEARMAAKPADFATIRTAAEDVCLIAFTSGTTGQPKGCMHVHRDIMATCDTFNRYVLRPTAEDVFTGSPPIAFTFGLGAQVLFPMHVGASTLLVEQYTPQKTLEMIQKHRVTILFTAPTAYRGMLDIAGQYDLSSLSQCISAGETLPRPTWEAWHQATGLKIIDGLGSTEMLHIFIACAGDDIRPGATGRAIPGYRACIFDEAGNPVGPGTVGRLAVRGPTGCRYLDNPERQRGYVQQGWNFTGDSYLADADGYYWYQARTDDMIISAGYNISGPEVEAVLLLHEAVKDCAVIGAADEARGQIVKAFIVLRDGIAPSSALVRALQDFAKAEIAPYKYPRAIEFIDELPRTQTGKVQRYVLRESPPG